jgi:hypothetical protein
MAHPQLQLHGSKKRRSRTDPAVVERFLDGQATLKEALLLHESFASELRAQARALADSGRWKQALDAFGGLAAVGEIHHTDPFYWAICHRGLGDNDKAEACLQAGRELCEEIERALEAKESESCSH